MRGCILVAALALGLVAAACGDGADSGDRADSGPDPEAARLCAEGEALVDSDPAKAIEILTRSIEKEKTARAYLARARAHLQTAESIEFGSVPASVEPDLEKALELDPGYTPALHFEADLLGRGTSAGKELLWKIVDTPVAGDDGLGFLLRARARASLADSLTPKPLPGEDEKYGGRFQQERADEDFARAAKLRPDDAELRFHWGYLLVERLGKWKSGAEKRGAEVLRECIALDPDGQTGEQAKALLDEM